MWTTLPGMDEMDSLLGSRGGGGGMLLREANVAGKGWKSGPAKELPRVRRPFMSEPNAESHDSLFLRLGLNAKVRGSRE